MVAFFVSLFVSIVIAVKQRSPFDWNSISIYCWIFGIGILVFCLVAMVRAPWHLHRELEEEISGLKSSLEEEVSRREIPDVIMEWISQGGQYGFDEVRLRNIGKASAFNVELFGFSWPELFFDAPVHVNAIHPTGPEVSAHPKFYESFDSGIAEIGRLNGILRDTRFKDRQPLEVFMRFSDTHENKFNRKFTLLPWHGGDWGPPLLVTPHKVQRS